MSAFPTTRLLVLGVVRIFQPVHGYFVRRELLSWQADEWAAVNPGSVYGQLRTLTRDAYMVEHLPGPRAGNVRYALTSDGEELFGAMLRRALYEPDGHDPGPAMAAACFLWTMPRDEVLAALEAREAGLRAIELKTGAALRGAPADASWAELPRMSAGLVGAQLAWTRDLRERVAAGAYAFHGEAKLEALTQRMLAEHAAELRAARGA